MAFKKTVTKKLPGFTGTLTAKDATWKVDVVTGSKTVMTATLRAYVDGQIVEEQDISFVPQMDGANSIKQAYEHIRALPDFADAIDC